MKTMIFSYTGSVNGLLDFLQYEIQRMEDVKYDKLREEADEYE